MLSSTNTESSVALDRKVLIISIFIAFFPFKNNSIHFCYFRTLLLGYLLYLCNNKDCCYIQQSDSSLNFTLGSSHLTDRSLVTESFISLPNFESVLAHFHVF